MTDPSVTLILVSSGAFALFLAVFWGFRKKLDDRHVIFIMMIAGLTLRLIYILTTDIDQRQHDVYSFEEMKGHAGYIGYLLNNAALPDFDPREIFQFYHPPLHHIIAALWMRLNLAAGISFDNSAENIQILTLLYSGLFMILTERIFRKIGSKGPGLTVAFALIAFHPAFIILSGSINNDMLSILLMQGAFLFALRWNDKRKKTDIALAAVFMGLGMMTKLSVGIAAAGIGFIFLLRFLQNKEERKGMIAGFAIFAAICFPLALWWGIRNAVLFGVPISYVPSLGDGSHQYIGHYSVYERLFDFSPYQFQSVYVAWGEPYFEHNVFIGLLKTASFGEQTLSDQSGPVYIAAQILFVSSAVIALLSVICGGVVMFREDMIRNRVQKGFVVVTGLTFLAAYIQFCFAYPHTCTQNIRYATPLIWIAALFIGKCTGEFFGKKTKWLPIAAVSAFSAASVLFYTLLAYK